MTKPSHITCGAAGNEADQRHLATPVSADQEAWLQGQLDFVWNVAADEEPPDAPVAPAGAPIVFLDLDDVVCLCKTVGGIDALECVTAKRIDVDFVYQNLFEPRPVEVLRQMHDAMGGRLRYVISSTWREHFTRAQLRQVLVRAGLGFVSACVEGRARWATPRLGRLGRYAEIKAWLAEHHAGEPFCVIDDWWSGSTLTSTSGCRHRVTLCKMGVGLEPEHLENMVRALGTPVDSQERW